MEKQVENREQSAYYGIRHISPWTIRKIRLFLDVGGDPSKLQRKLRSANTANATHVPKEMVDYFASSIGDCVRHMVANPSVGVCVNFDGDDRWEWQEDVQKRTPSLNPSARPCNRTETAT